ncbi:hypothetical protein GYB59_02250 [bacterium]|nr:hypothetical protein [bacterium]
MDAAKDINEQAAANEQRAKVAKQVELKQAEASKLDERVESLREKRLALMDSATWPVEGLGFGPDGVTFNGLPFDQCSSAEQLKISTAIGLSQNPTIRLMIIRDGSLLDDESLAMVDQLARENDAQILVERVGQGKPGEIVIEDGEVAEQVAAQSA